jgi:heterodisulfide reductase subunit B
MEKILDLTNVDYYTLDDEECCGSVLLRTGFVEEAKKQMKKNLNKFENDKILVSCAGCYKTLKKDYPQYLGKNLDVVHVSQFLNDLIKEGKFEKLIKDEKLDLTVTYHDPCHLGRHGGEFEAPRNVINYFANLNEMKNNRDNSKCCGSGGGVKSAFPEIAKSIAISRSEEAESTNSDMLVTSCPFCKLNLDENYSSKVLDLSEFVLSCLCYDKDCHNNEDVCSDTHKRFTPLNNNYNNKKNDMVFTQLNDNNINNKDNNNIDNKNSNINININNNSNINNKDNNKNNLEFQMVEERGLNG